MNWAELEGFIWSIDPFLDPFDIFEIGVVEPEIASEHLMLSLRVMTDFECGDDTYYVDEEFYAYASLSAPETLSLAVYVEVAVSPNQYQYIQEKWIEEQNLAMGSAGAVGFLTEEEYTFLGFEYLIPVPDEAFKDGETKLKIRQDVALLLVALLKRSISGSAELHQLLYEGNKIVSSHDH